MAIVHYVECSLCRKEYYLDRMLAKVLISNPMQKLKCPWCKKYFNLETKKAQEKGAC